MRKAISTSPGIGAILTGIILATSINAGVALFFFWLLTGPGGLSINGYLFATLAFLASGVINGIRRNQQA